MLPALLHEIVFIEGAAIPARQAAAPFLYDLTQEEQSKSQVETAAVSVAVEEEAVEDDFQPLRRLRGR